MAEESKSEGQQEDFAPITSQEELDRRIGERLKRERDKVAGQFSDYEDLKAKAAKFDDIEQAQKSELERAKERADKAEAEIERMRESARQSALVSKVAEEAGVPASLLKGGTEEELRASADAIAAFAKAQQPAYPSDKGAGVPGGAKPLTEADIMAIKDPRERLRARIAANEGK